MSAKTETSDRSIPHIIDIADKYYTSKPEESKYYKHYEASSILSDMSMLCHFQILLHGCEHLGELNETNIFEIPLLFMFRYSNKLLLYLIVDVKTAIDKLSNHTSNISYLFHTAERTFGIDEAKYCIPIIETHMENPCNHKHDFNETTEKRIQNLYDLLERLENQLAAKIKNEGKEDNKHEWIRYAFSFDYEDKDEPPYTEEWRNMLDEFYKVRDEQIQKKKDEEDKQRRINELIEKQKSILHECEELNALIAKKSAELKKRNEELDALISKKEEKELQE